MNIVLFAPSGYGNVVFSRLRAQGHVVPIVFTSASDDAFEQAFQGETLAEQARSAGVLVFAGIDSVKDAGAFDALRACAPDLLVVVNGYDRTVSTHAARSARDAVYLHPALLPRYRGGSPSNWALIEGESATGVTLSKLTRRHDDGTVLARRSFLIDPLDTDGTLREKTGSFMADLLAEYCAGSSGNTLIKRGAYDQSAAFAGPAERHDHRNVAHHMFPRGRSGFADERRLNDPDVRESAVASGGTMYPLISPRDGHLRFDQSTVKIINRVRGVTPYPGAYTDDGDKEMPILAAFPESLEADDGEDEPGTVLDVRAEGREIVVRTLDGGVRLRTAGEHAFSVPASRRRIGKRTPFSARAIDGGAIYDIVTPDESELERYREFPDMVVVAVAYPCNAHCPNCPYVPENSAIRAKYGDAQFMDSALFMKIADECGEAAWRKWLPGGVGSFVRITGGGEPMLHPYGMTKLIAYAMNAGAQVYLNTNGSLLTKDDIDALLACRIDNIEVSVDAADAKTYAIARKGLDWDHLLETMRYLIDERNRTKSPSTIEVSVINQDLVAGRVAEIEAFWYDFGVDNVIVRKFLTWGSSTDIDPNASADPMAYLDRDGGVPCPYPFQRLNIDSRGKVEVCGFDITGRTDMGNVREQSIREIWRGAQFSWWREKHRCGQGGDIPLCAECPDWKYRSWDHNYRKALDHARQRRDEAIGMPS